MTERNGATGGKGWTGGMVRRVFTFLPLLPRLPRLPFLSFLPLLPFLTIQPLYAQSPNTSTIVVTVTDQSGAVVPGATVSVTNTRTGAVRTVETGRNGSAMVAALPLTGTYDVEVALAGFVTERQRGVILRGGETATLRVRLIVGSEPTQVTVYGTAEGVRGDAEIGRTLDSKTIDETPILGRKVSSVPLLNSAFRSGKGTGDLFVNATYFVTGAGSRRTTSFTVDGVNNDEGWGRQTMMSTVPIGAVQEMSTLSNAFSAEFGWTAGPAVSIVTKSGTNDPHGEALVLGRPGGWQARTFGTTGFCPPSVATCVTPTTLTAVNPADVPDALAQFSGAIGAALVKDRTFFFASGDYTAQDRTTYLASSLPSFVLPADGNLAYTGNYRQGLLDLRADHKLSNTHTLMVRGNFDRFYDTNPNDAVGGTSAPSVARRYTRGALTGQANLTTIISSTLVNEGRLAYLDGDPVTRWEAQTLSTTYTRSGTVPFTVGQSRVTDTHSRQLQLSDTLSWSRGAQTIRLGGSLARHNSGGFGNEPGFAMLGTFAFLNTTTAPLDQLTLKDVQNYSQPISYGVTDYSLSQWLISGYVQDSLRVRGDLTLDLGLRYDVQTLTDAKNDFAPRLGFGWHPNGDERLAIRGGYGMYYSAIQSNVIADSLIGGLDGFTTYTATAGQLGFPTCLVAPCVPLQFDPRTLPPSELPARNITIRPGEADFYRGQFAQYGLNFDLLPNYPDKLVNPRSQVASIGVERGISHGFVVSADYVKQHWTNLARTVDLNAPSPFDRTAAGQVRSVAAANATRPILPVNGGVRSVNVLTNLGVADYDGLQTQLTYRAVPKLYAAVSYTLSKATNTTEPDGNGIAPNDGNIERLGEVERGPSVLDQRHRAVITVSYEFPYGITAGTVTGLASARPFNATTGVDNNGDGSNNDRPVIDGAVVGKSAFRGTATQDVNVFVEERIGFGSRSLLLRLECFNLFNHANMLGRAQTTYGDTGAADSAFGQLVSVGTAANALPALANIDPPRMFQIQARFQF
jgi:Carboxypeptidase regulatory-like domain